MAVVTVTARAMHKLDPLTGRRGVRQVPLRLITRVHLFGTARTTDRITRLDVTEPLAFDE